MSADRVAGHNDAQAWLVGAEAAALAAAVGEPHLFGSAAWAWIVEGLGCGVVHAWHRATATPLIVPVFRRGPLRIGFFGFPHAGGVADALPPEVFDADARALGRLLRLDIVRGTRCGLAEPQAGEALPEVWTDDLANWPGAARKRIQRDCTRAAKACALLEFADEGGDAAAWYRLYADTVRRNGGHRRYTREYFQRLQRASADGAPLRIFHARKPDGETIAFAVLAMHLGSGFYLHAGADPAWRASGVGDLLLRRAILAAREAGMQRFSLMASPAAQTGLVRFKRKWAERQGWSVTQDHGIGFAGRLALAALRAGRSVRARIGRVETGHAGQGEAGGG